MVRNRGVGSELFAGVILDFLGWMHKRVIALQIVSHIVVSVHVIYDRPARLMQVTLWPFQ